MGATLQNLTRQPQTFILHAPGEFGESLPKSVQAVVLEHHDPRTGARSTTTRKRNFPASISLQPKGFEGDALGDLPDAVAYAPEVVRAARAGVVKVTIVAMDLGADAPPDEAEITTPEEA